MLSATRVFLATQCFWLAPIRVFRNKADASLEHKWARWLLCSWWGALAVRLLLVWSWLGAGRAWHIIVAALCVQLGAAVSLPVARAAAKVV